MALYVVRHGDAEGNKEGRLLGQVDPPLTKTGRHQAELIAGFFARYDLRQIWSSDLERARQTAEIIAQKVGLEVLLTPDLREVDQGVIDGWYAADIRHSRYGPERDKDKYGFRAPFGESYHDIEGRISRAVFAPMAEPGLIVTHTGPMRILLHLIGGLSPSHAAAAKIGHFDAIVISNADGVRQGRLLRDFVGSEREAEAA